MTSYSELLRDPLWQKKRLEVLSRDDFTCRRCKATDKTLNVHHCHYKRGNAPWEYEGGSLVTLCEPCHEYETAMGRSAKHELEHALCAQGYLTDDFAALSRAVADDKVRDAITLVLCCYYTGRPLLGLLNRIGSYFKDTPESELTPGASHG